MNRVQLLRDQLKWAHDTQEATMSDVTKEAADFNKTGEAIPVGAAYAHSIWGEDMVVSTILAGKEPLLKDGTEVGLSIPVPTMDNWSEHANWYKTVKVDLSKMREFAKKVYQATDDYLASLSEEDLDKELDLSSMGMGKQTVVYVFTNFVLLHIANLTGQLS